MSAWSAGDDLEQVVAVDPFEDDAVTAFDRLDAVDGGDADAGIGSRLQDRRLRPGVFQRAARAEETEDAAVAVLEDFGLAAFGDLLELGYGVGHLGGDDTGLRRDARMTGVTRELSVRAVVSP